MFVKVLIVNTVRMSAFFYYLCKIKLVTNK